MRDFIPLTRLEREALIRLAKVHTEFPSNTSGFFAGEIGARHAAACRRIGATGLVNITRIANGCFRYALSESGRRRVAAEPTAFIQEALKDV